MEFRARRRRRPLRRARHVILNEQRWSFGNGTFVGEDHSDHRLVSLGFGHGSHRGCKFENLRVQSVSFGQGNEFVECSFDKLRADHVSGGDTRFVRCSFRDVSIRELLSYQCQFIDCVFTGRIRRGWLDVILKDDDLARYGRTMNRVEGNDFSGLRMEDFELRKGIRLSEQRQLPEDGNYIVLLDTRTLLQQAYGKIATSLPDNPELRQWCLRVLDYQLRSGIGSIEDQQSILWLDESHNDVAALRTIRDSVLDVLSAR